MKILLISPHVPGPNTPQAGERLVFELIKALAGQHELHLVVRVPRGEEQSLAPIRPLCKAVHPVSYRRPARRNIFTIIGVLRSYYKLCRRADEIADREAFDCIHAEWTETGLFLKKRKTRTLIEAHDVLSKPMERKYRNAGGLKRVVRFLIWRLTTAFERHVYKKFDTVLVLSDYDRNYLLSIAPGLNVAVVHYPHGVNLTERMYHRDANSILFLAAMDRGPNVEAVMYFWKKIFPLIRERVPEAKFYIVGSRPVPEVRALAERDKNTIVTGFVDDIERYYKTCTVFVAPLLTGGGIIVKNLDALASGTPVVTTSIGNEGIGATAGEHLLIGDTPEEFARAVILLLQDEPLRRKIGGAGMKFVSSRFSLDALRKTLETIYPDQNIQGIRRKSETTRRVVG